MSRTLVAEWEALEGRTSFTSAEEAPGLGPVFCYCPAATVTDRTWTGFRHNRTGFRHNIRPKAMWCSHTLCFCACRPVTQCSVWKLLLHTLWTSDVIHRVVKATVMVRPKDDVTALSLILVFRKVFCGLWGTKAGAGKKRRLGLFCLPFFIIWGFCVNAFLFFKQNKEYFTIKERLMNLKREKMHQDMGLGRKKMEFNLLQKCCCTMAKHDLWPPQRGVRFLSY